MGSTKIVNITPSPEIEVWNPQKGICKLSPEIVSRALHKGVLKKQGIISI